MLSERNENELEVNWDGLERVGGGTDEERERERGRVWAMVGFFAPQKVVLIDAAMVLGNATPLDVEEAERLVFEKVVQAGCCLWIGASCMGATGRVPCSEI